MSQPTLPSSREIARLQTRLTQAWHGGENAEAQNSALLSLIERQHRSNFDLWHEEDKARAPDATDAQVATVKRAIDKINQQRNDQIEKIDDFLLEQLKEVKPAPSAPWNSETPGGIIDRLSIISLKIYHMQEQVDRPDASAQHRQNAQQRLSILLAQQNDLTTALGLLLEDLRGGRKQMKVYRQFKMYNDPNYNPAIYGVKK